MIVVRPLVSALAGLLLALPMVAQDDPTPQTPPKPDPTAEAQQDPLDLAAALELDALKSDLVPLTKSELVVEADAWRDLVKQKCTEIAAAEKSDQTTADQMTALVEARTRLIDRANAVVAALTTKGAKPEETEEYKTYFSAVSGISLKGGFLTAIVNWAQSPEGGIRWAINIGMFILILIVFRILSRVIGKITGKAVARMKGASDLLRSFFVNTVRKVTFFIGVIIALSYLEVDIGPFLAAMGVAGFVIGFALQGTLSNFASGIMILMYRPYDLGDVVSVAGVTGKVDAMTLVSTTVKTGDNQLMVVPNGSIWGDVITNITGEQTRRVDLVFGIGYTDDIDKAERILLEIVTAHELVLKDPEPVIKVHELADSSVNLAVRPWAKTSDYWTVKWDVTKAVKQRFDKEGISIPFPQRDVHLFQQATT